MSLRIDEDVLERIGEQFKRAVKASVEEFGSLAADEDSLTGAVAARFHDKVRGKLNGYQWSTTVYKFPTQEENVDTEGEVGADMAVTIEHKRPRIPRMRKTLLIQAKKRGNPHYDDLMEQARNLTRLPGTHVVVEYSDDGYRSAPAETVVGVKGHLAECRDQMDDLGDALAGKFLQCQIGCRGLRYDHPSRQLKYRGATGVTNIRAKVRLLTHTQVSIVA